MSSERSLVWRLILFLGVGAAITWPSYAQQVKTTARVQLANRDQEYQKILESQEHTKQAHV